ncbi:MAG: tetratricopeptide repeat protein [Bacteroidota bacterium]
MKRIAFVSIIGLVAFLTSCGTDSTPKKEGGITKDSVRKMSIARIKKLEGEMHQTMELNNVTAGLALTAYTEFVNLFPDDSLSADFLFKAGEVATAIKQYPQALSYYKNITDKYPTYKNYVMSLYLQGFLQDNYLNADDKAKEIYSQVLEKYPTSTFANDAKAAIQNLGKSDEQLIKEFKKKNGQK